MSKVAEAPSAELRRIAGRHSSLAAGLVKYRLQRKQSFQIGLRPVAFVAIAACFRSADAFAGIPIDQGHGHVNGRDFFAGKILRPAHAPFAAG